MLRKLSLATCVCALGASSVIGAANDPALPLYVGTIPGAIEAPDEEAIRDPSEAYPFRLNISRPTLTPYLPSSDSQSAAIIILPGGSYRGVSIVKEGHDVAVELRRQGVAAFVLKYRTPSARHMADRANGPLQDAQQAIRMVRQHAAEWRVDPKRVGLLGFSAGGHLALLTALRSDAASVVANAPSLRPDFLLLVYPVVSMLDPIAHATSRQQLLGDSPTLELQRAYSNELHVSERTPPTFIVHAGDDRSVPVEHSLRLYEALHAHGVSTELHIYPGGGHGFGLRNATTDERWLDRAVTWMSSQNVLR